MKLNKIFISGLAMLALTSCNDYLEVDPATNVASTDLVFGSEGETRTALYGVYAKVCSDNLFGGKLYNDFQLNSDVDFYANSNEAAAGNQPRRFDVRSDAGNVETLWNNLYSAVETANEFIFNLQNSSIYAEETEDAASEAADGTITTVQVPKVTSLTQMMGEAKVMRAMFYHELLSYWGDIPFTLKSTYETDDLNPAITARQQVSDALIADLKHAAEYMYSDQDGKVAAPERITQEAAYAMIARLALQAGGYSLNHDANNATEYKMTRPDNYKEYYQIARDYAKKVIDAGGHALNKSYRDLFIDECNFVAATGDDPIFEIPFAKETNGSWGYAQGPTNGVDTGDDTDYSNSAWGATSGGVRTTAFYGYSFDAKDLRRDYICGLWYYSSQGLPTMRLDYAMHNNKWSKLWNSNGLGKTTTGATGINFAYIRYADVLLMFAEADNEINNGPTADAKEALKTVRNRAFAAEDQGEKVNDYVDAASTKEDFLKLVLDERKWEFAGENMRWKDLVRNNMYAEKVFFTFLDYFAITEAMAGTSSYIDMVEEYDKVPYSDVFVQSMYSILVKNYVDPNFPNRGLYMFYIANPYNGAMQNPTGTAPAKYFEDIEMDDVYSPVSPKSITGLSTASNTIAWTTTTLAWSNDDGTPKNQIVYSLYGYIRINQAGNIVVVNNGSAQPFNINPNDAQANISRLPAVRYLLPIPDEAIARSGGVYQNYYGY
jgi:hypothetical protein